MSRSLLVTLTVSLSIALGALLVSAARAEAPCPTPPTLHFVDDPSVSWGGRYERWGDGRPTIVLNVAPGLNAHGLDWTLRHELGHAQADRLGLPASERYADRVADGKIALTCSAVESPAP